MQKVDTNEIFSRIFLKDFSQNDVMIFSHDTPPRQILIYRSVLSPVSPLYYSVASNAGIGQSPYPFVGRGFTPAAFFDSRRSLRRDASIFRFAKCQVCFANIAPTLRTNCNTNRQRIKYLSRNSFVADSRGRLSLQMLC